MITILCLPKLITFISKCWYCFPEYCKFISKFRLYYLIVSIISLKAQIFDILYQKFQHFVPAQFFFQQNFGFKRCVFFQISTINRVTSAFAKKCWPVVSTFRRFISPYRLFFKFGFYLRETGQKCCMQTSFLRSTGFQNPVNAILNLWC